MSTSLKEYIKKCKRYDSLSKYTLGIAMGYLFTNNYYGLASAIITSIFLKLSAGIAKRDSVNSKEFQALKELYNIILEKLADNIRLLELGDIEGIFAYICYLKENNYLSYDENLPNYNTYIFNERAILEALSLNNHGVCRHNAPMLTSLYKHFDIESHSVTGILYRNVPIIVKEEDALRNKEMADLLRKCEDNPDLFEEFIEMVNDRVMSLIEKNIADLEASPSGNHVITQANSKDNTYLLDPTHRTFYNEARESGRFYASNGDFFKLVSAKRKKNYLEGISQMEFTDKKPIISQKEMEKRLKERQKRIEENQDIIADMHADITPFLAEANEVYQLILRVQ